MQRLSFWGHLKYLNSSNESDTDNISNRSWVQGSKVHGFKGSGFRGSKVQGFKGSGVQRFMGSKVQRFRVQRLENDEN